MLTTHDHGARGTDGPLESTWLKRVRVLENSLGYSNFVHNLLSKDYPQARNSELHEGDIYLSQSRKRKLSGLCMPQRFPYSNVQLDAPKMGSNDVVVKMPEERLVPLTRFIGPQTSSCGTKSPSESLKFRGAPSPDMFSGGSVSSRLVPNDAKSSSYSESPEDQVHGCHQPPGRTHGECGIGMISNATCAVDPLGNRSIPEAERISSEGKSEPGSLQDYVLLPEPSGQVGTHYLADGTMRGVIESGSLHRPTKACVKKKEQTAHNVDEAVKPRVIVVGALPSRHQLSPIRTCSSISRLSPKNPLSSHAVVARMKQSLQSGGEKHPKALLLGSGTYNPIHKQHMRRFFLAKTFLEAEKGMHVIGGIVSPSHPTFVRQRHRVRAAEIIPPKHRLSMARAAVGDVSWLVVDPWEVTRKRIMDYMSVLEHVKEVCFEAFPGQANNITILYMCQASQIHHLNPALLRAGGFGVITVCRPLEKERLLKELTPSFRNIANVVEDAAILSAELEKTSSAMVRHLLKQGRSVEGMVGKAVARYIQENYIARRVSGRQKWTPQVRVFASSPA